MDIKNQEWLEIFLWYPCNQKCNFCFQKDLRFQQRSFLDFEEVIKIIDSWFLEWKKDIIFSGWEATMDKNLKKYIDYCKKKWFKNIRVHTNWLYFADNNNLLDYYNLWMSWVIISIHWYSDIHDKIVKVPGAFDKIKKTLLNIFNLKKADKNFVLDTNTVLTRLNYNSIHILTKFLSYFPVTRSQIVQLYSLYLFDINEKKDLYVSYDEFSKYIPRIVETNKNITFENFPLCKVDRRYWNFILKRQKYNNDAYGNMWEWFEESDCMFLSSCEKCSEKQVCSWIPKNYLQVFSLEKFTI